MEHGKTDHRTRLIDQLESLRADLQTAQTIDQIKHLRGLAETCRAYAVNRDLGLDLQNHAAEIKLQAERRLGAMLASLKLRGGDRKSGRRRGMKLKDLGIDKNQSARWQLEASVPDGQFRSYIQSAHANGQEISSAALLRLARRLKTQKLAEEPPEIRDFTVPVIVPEVDYVMSVDIDRSPPPASDVNELSELVDEAKNHRRTLTGLVDSVCERAGIQPDAGERRAICRYFREIDRQLDRIELGLQTLARDHQFLASVFAS